MFGSREVLRGSGSMGRKGSDSMGREGSESMGR
jgi:hypothetical protein